MNDVNHKLHRETQAAKALLANFADILGMDEQTSADMVEGSTNLNEAIDDVVQSLVNDKTAVLGLESIIAILTSRRDRLEARIANMRTALAAALEQAGKKKVEHPAVTLSLRNVPPSVVVQDEAAIPSAYWKPSDPKLDKKALLVALKAKENIPGVSLSNGGSCIALSWG